ncbi:M56 family metallopeptidase [Colwellia sp. D2M02]|uniref:M56 family metallopeptidase n=1 Tax=Colwellia sp. D2M02 TaxID=2841562 RepID=UPI001C09C7BD|nr:M56 family metallopeptidase [Colwellia sp. D2M02]MBU2893578.1 M56 family metallopeptidase [Colwellia sp. D2M02]
MLAPLFNTPILYSLALTLLHFLWQGLLIAAIVKFVLLFIDKSRPQIRYVLCAAAMLANLCTAIITFNIILPTSDLLNSSTPSLALNNLTADIELTSSLSGYQELLPSLLAYVLPYLSLAWLAIILVLTVKLLIEIRNVNLLPQHASKLPEKQLQRRFIELSQQVKLTRIPTLLISMKAEVPMAIGIFKPVVLIPVTMVTGLSPAQLEMLLLHELAHIRRHDYLVNFLQTIIELLFFFHPSVHWLAKNMRNEREYCSDDIAVKHCGDPIAYAHTLTDTATLCLHQHTIPNMAMAASGGDLKERVVRLVDHHCAPKNDIGKWFAAMTLLLFIAIFFIQQLFASNYSPRWVYHLPWQAQHLASTESPYIASLESSLDDSIITTDSIAQQLLLGPGDSAHQKQEQSPSIETSLTISSTSIDSVATDVIPTNDIVGTDLVANTLSRSDKTIKVFNTNLGNQSISTDNLLATKQSLDHEYAINDLDLAVNLSSIKQLPKELKVELKAEKVTQILPRQTLLAESQGETTYLNNQQENNTLLVKSAKPIKTQKNEVANKVERISENISLDNIISTEPYQSYELALTQREEKPIERKFKQSSTVQHSISSAQRKYEAKQLTSVDPVYPSLAKRKGIEIEVKVRFTIDRNGEVKDINFSQQSRLNYFKSAIRTAMRQWRFMPAKVDNKVVESQMSKIFSFSLQG